MSYSAHASNYLLLVISDAADRLFLSQVAAAFLGAAHQAQDSCADAAVHSTWLRRFVTGGATSHQRRLHPDMWQKGSSCVA
jgi:hypothetical protein